ncbi:MAG: hypothetical protein ACRD0Z_01235 [Acidimicrobiales bacterium]
MAAAGGDVCSAGLGVNDVLNSGRLPRGSALIAMLRRLDSSLTSAQTSLDAAQTQVGGARSSLLLPPISGRLNEAIVKVSAATHDD